MSFARFVLTVVLDHSWINTSRLSSAQCFLTATSMLKMARDKPTFGVRLVYIDRLVIRRRALRSSPSVLPTNSILS